MKQSILILEEVAAIRYLLTTVLGKEYSVLAHSDCYHAMTDLQSRDVQLIIVNIDDADCRNFNFLVHLNSSSLFSEIPVVVISNNTSNEFRLKCLDLGVDAFFLKPFDPLSIIECVKVNLYLSENMSHMSEAVNMDFEHQMEL